MRIYKVFTLLGLFSNVNFLLLTPIFLPMMKKIQKEKIRLLPNFLGKEKQINSLSILKKESI